MLAWVHNERFDSIRSVLPRRRSCVCLRGGSYLAAWPDLPALWRCREEPQDAGQEHTRIGVYKCYDCRLPFTVKIGTIFEASHIPMRVWLQAIFFVASSKKGVSSKLTSSDAWDQFEIGLVHVAQNP